MPIGALDWSIIISSAIAVVLLFIAAGFALRYTNIFYGDRPVPRSWLFIMLGLLANALAEAGELGIFIETVLWAVIPGIPEGMFTLASQTVGGVAIAVGAYMLWKEIP